MPRGRRGRLPLRGAAAGAGRASSRRSNGKGFWCSRGCPRGRDNRGSESDQTCGHGSGHSQGLPEKGFADRVELLVDDVEIELAFVLLLEIVVSQREESGGDKTALLFLQRNSIARHQVAGDLLLQKPVIGRSSLKAAMTWSR